MDEDFALALRLQEEFDRQAAEEAGNATATSADGNKPNWGPNDVTNNLNTSMSLVDERWETLDPNPDARTLFLQFNDRFFWGRLAGVEVRWSPRMTLCAGLCSYEGHGGLCSIRLSQPLLKLRPRKDLIETLLHEMIHAYLFVTANNRDHDAHGPEFHKHMYRINQETGTNISVYHNFHDEVDHHRTHWWKCDGPCQKRPPYFGIVKRSMNRAPHPRDTWWADHQASCGGSYTKIKEPEDYGKKKSKTSKSRESSPVKPKGVPDIRSMFGATKDKNSSTTDNGASTSASKSLMGSINSTQPKLPSFPGGGVTLGSSSSKPSQPSSAAGAPPKKTGMGSPSEDLRILSPPSKDAFKGRGVTLGGTSSETTEKPNGIVRKIPGIGLISCERPVIASASTGRPSTPPVALPLSPLKVNSEDRIKQGGTKRRSDEEASHATKRRRSEPVGGKRNSIGDTGKRRSITLDELLAGTSPGSCKKVPGMRSVSRKGATPPEFVRKDPALVEEERLWHIRKGKNTPKGGLHILKKTPSSAASTSTATYPSANTSIPKINFSDNEGDDEWISKPKPKNRPPRDLAFDRNRRAINGDDSESDSDSENRALASAISKKLGISESKGVYSWSPPKTAISGTSTPIKTEKPWMASQWTTSSTSTISSTYVPIKTENSIKIENPVKIEKPWMTSQSMTASSSTSNYVSNSYTSAAATASSSTEDILKPWSTASGFSTNSHTATASGLGGATVVDLQEDLQECPVCQTLVYASLMNTHLDACLEGGIP